MDLRFSRPHFASAPWVIRTNTGGNVSGACRPGGGAPHACVQSGRGGAGLSQWKRTVVKRVINFERHACTKAVLLDGRLQSLDSASFMMRSTLPIGIICHHERVEAWRARGFHVSGDGQAQRVHGQGAGARHSSARCAAHAHGGVCSGMAAAQPPNGRARTLSSPAILPDMMLATSFSSSARESAASRSACGGRSGVLVPSIVVVSCAGAGGLFGMVKGPGPL